MTETNGSDSEGFGAQRESAGSAGNSPGGSAGGSPGGPGAEAGGGRGLGRGPFGGKPFGGASRLFDDLAGVAGGAFSLMTGMREEMASLARSQAEQLVQRLDLARHEDLDAALELARRAREQQIALEARVEALEAKLAALGAKPEGKGRSKG